MVLPGGEWFVIRSGDHEGEWHLSGWQLSALDGGRGLGYANCPVCYAMVCADEKVCLR
jgi:hypothetical protein